MIWRSNAYREHVRRFGCAVCGDPNTIAAHVGGIALRGTAVKAPDWTCCPLCEEHHDKLDGRILPPLTQSEREDVMRGVILVMGSYLESQADSDQRKDLPSFGQRKPGSNRGTKTRMGFRKGRR